MTVVHLHGAGIANGFSAIPASNPIPAGCFRLADVAGFQNLQLTIPFISSPGHNNHFIHRCPQSSL